MTYHEFKSELSKFLNSQGFKKRGNVWAMRREDLCSLLVMLSKSSFSDDCYIDVGINAGIVPRSPKLHYPIAWDLHVRADMVEVELRLLLQLDYPINDIERMSNVKKLISNMLRNLQDTYPDEEAILEFARKWSRGYPVAGRYIRAYLGRI